MVPPGGAPHTAPSRSCTRSRTAKTRSSRRSSWTSPTASIPRWRRSAATPRSSTAPRRPGRSIPRGRISDQQLRDALALPKKVLVVWLFDQTASATQLRHEVVAHLPQLYRELPAGPEKPKPDENAEAPA